MRVPHPRSLRGLIVLGTVLVAAPFIGAVIHATVQMRVLTQRSTSLIARTAAATRAGQELARSSTAVERAARLRLALGDDSMDDVFHQNVQRTEAALTGLVADTDTDSDLNRSGDAVRRRIADLAAAFSDASARSAKAGDPALRAAIERYTPIAGDLSRLDRQLADRTAASLSDIQASTATTESRLYRELAVILPVSILLVVGFLTALARPLRRIDRAIDALGRGHYDGPVEVGGPAYLVKLGAQLEWLRLRLIEVGEAKNRFLRHMSHELKTPLASIREGTELLLEGAVGALSPEQREVASILRDNGVKLQRHIENLLSYSAWEAQTGSLELEEFPLRDLLRTVIDAHRMTLLTHHLRLTVDVGDVTVTADRGKLRLILDNLLSNAVKYTPDNGSIDIRATTDGAGLIVEVIDTGPGIAPEDRERLFEAFYTGRSEANGPLRGTGIGLSVVLEFTEAHGGRIELVDGEGTGAHFRLRLPAYPRPARKPAVLHDA